MRLVKLSPYVFYLGGEVVGVMWSTDTIHSALGKWIGSYVPNYLENPIAESCFDSREAPLEQVALPDYVRTIPDYVEREVAGGVIELTSLKYHGLVWLIQTPGYPDVVVQWFDASVYDEDELIAVFGSETYGTWPAIFGIEGDQWAYGDGKEKS